MTNDAQELVDSCEPEYLDLGVQESNEDLLGTPITDLNQFNLGL